MAATRDYDLGPHMFPRGWFMVADAATVTSKPLAERFFGRDVVLYRGQSGRVFMVDAYCPHMGTHLGKNSTSYVIHDGVQVEGDNIRCPYHAWRFGPDGKCNEIPNFSGPIPERAALKTWNVEEKYGCIFAWHDVEGGAPDFALPNIEAWDDPHYVRWELDHLGEIACHPVEITDNMADVAHLGPTHGGPPIYFRNEIEGVICKQFQGAPHRTLEQGVILETDTFYTGPGILLSYFNGGGSIMFIAHTPIDDGKVKAWHGMLVQTANAPPSLDDVAMARAVQAGGLAAFAQDFEIWTNKAPCFQHLAVPSDGAFSKIRAWYKQFYHPRARAKELQARADGVYPVRGMPTHAQSAA